jgi:uncharacterized protein YacL
MLNELFSRLVAAIVFGFAGWLMGGALGGQGTFAVSGPLPMSLALVGVLLGIFLAPFITTRPVRAISQAPAAALMAVVTGLLTGLIAGALLALPLSLLPGIYGKIIPVVVAVIVSYLCIAVLLAHSKDLSMMWPGSGSFSRGGARFADTGSQLIVDTSAIIDGRIADISQTGFIRGPLIIPKFVLQELQYVADSSDAQRRKRGRRGLDMLNKLQKESDVPIQISDVDYEDAEGVDAKLVRLARESHSTIITNDSNLIRVAELQGVKALNINELALALKPVVLSGEELDIRITQEGKEPGQGVGFLDDGTMVVVEGGRRYLNSQVGVVVTRVLQTAIGRMIFAQLKDGAYHER